MEGESKGCEVLGVEEVKKNICGGGGSGRTQKAGVVKQCWTETTGCDGEMRRCLSPLVYEGNSNLQSNF